MEYERVWLKDSDSRVVHCLNRNLDVRTSATKCGRKTLVWRAAGVVDYYGFFIRFDSLNPAKIKRCKVCFPHG